MMRLRLERQRSGRDSTLGKLFVNGTFFCYTLEDVVREVPGKSVADWKVKGLTAIPAGTYDVQITYSNRFGRDLPLLKNVPGFDGIRIHSGNTAADTEGCILVGDVLLPNGTVGMSRVAFNRLFAQLDAAYDRHEPIQIEVVPA